MGSQREPAVLQASESVCEIVAAVLSHKGELALLRRSNMVTGDVGRWNCITGFLDHDHEPLSQALTEVEEEAGISKHHLKLLSSSVLHLLGQDGRTWRVYAFHFHSRTRTLTLNWENDASVWLAPQELDQLSTVSWFAHILDACGLTS
ncbi:NUDIX domain-containing protein [Pseudomonas sp. BN102]|uniref:NUDIX domain-containing protein n=1 Tax=Pseudomonas sp. BN102 TaxID=2567886 RepID=UPI002454F50F|nr:NUDIX domain-containing protein [Pseudomonas sp. BN102]